MWLRNKLNSMSQLEIFGHPASVTYKGERTFSTKLGSVCTITLTVFICINLVQLIIAYHVGSNMESKNGFNYIDFFGTDRYYLQDMQVELALFKNDHPFNEYSKFTVLQIHPCEESDLDCDMYTDTRLEEVSVTQCSVEK